MKIKSTLQPALAHLESGWYVIAGTILEVDGVPHAGGWLLVPPETTLADIEFVRDEPEKKKPLYTTTCQSESDPSIIYEVGEWRDGHITCTCPGFLYRKKCKHQRAWLDGTLGPD